jgi:hypothetical protein
MLSAWRRRDLRIGADVLFYSASWIDDAWVRSTAVEAAKRGMTVAVAVSGGTERPDPAVLAQYRASSIRVFFPLEADALRQFVASVVVSATNGLRRDLFHPGMKHLVHMPHSLVSLHMIYAGDSFDAFDTLFASGPHHVREFLRLGEMRGLPPRQAPLVGYGKLDLLGARVADAPVPRDVLIGPSWGERNILNTIGAPLIDALLAAGCRVTPRPHPLFVLRRDAAWSGLVERFATHPRFVSENPFEGDAAILRAGVVVTDYSGIAFEYAALRERPCVFVDVAKKVVNPEWERVGLDPVEVALRARLGAIVPPDADAAATAVLQFADMAGKSGAVGDALPSFIVHNRRCAPAAVSAVASLLERKAA